ncbi:MAG: ATP-dependent helicase HrpA [Pseudomonadota bacterium]|jgi:ATP-dependent helicase HrpA
MDLTALITQIKQTHSNYTDYWLRNLAKLKSRPQQLAKLVTKIENELTNLALRRDLLTNLTISYPNNLPVAQALTEIEQLIKDNQIVIVCGETGSGKTTQLPKLLLAMGYGITGLIGHTQPRRIAAHSLTRRIAEELNCDNNLHNLVACKMRFHDRTSPSTALKLMTDGVLLQEIRHDRLLLRYSALIIDEVHERSLNIDFLLGYLRQLMVKRPDLKIIITSATMENDKLAKFFANAPIINVSGKTYPVDIIYQPLSTDEELNLNQQIYQAISSALSVEQGNGLVFLPGEREIKYCLQYLRKTELRRYNLLALFSRQNNEEQSKIFANDGQLKIILATNIAETSLTIPNIKFVIDSGLARVKRYSLRNRVEQLQIEPISQASCAQRSGRAGRQSHGLSIRLFSEQDFLLRPQFTQPEILRSNLANVILRLLDLELGDPTQFNFLDQPETKAFNDGLRTLFQLGAIDQQQKITGLGRKLSRLPIDVQLARIIIAGAEQFACLHEVLIICSFLAIQDPRDTPLEHQQLAKERHSIWQDKKSEFNQILNLWTWYHQQLEHKKSNKKLQEICHKQFVSLVRLKEWHELHRQLKESIACFNYRENSQAANYTNLHSALLTGFILNIGQRDLVENYYLSTNARKFYLHPSSIVDSAKWMVSANLVDTSRLYARINAQIEPDWLNQIAQHLYKYTYTNQHWDKKRGEVIATKSSLLYGLLISQSKVSYAQIDQVLARDIFIKQALVAMDLPSNYKFIQHNQQVVYQLTKLEDKLRTSLAIIDDELYNFYRQNLPDNVCDNVSLTQFINQSPPNVLKLNLADLIQRLNNSIEDLSLFPDHILNNGEQIRLHYVFDHLRQDDGVTAIIDLAQLALLTEEPFEWLVAGMIREKITWLIKSLPKTLRLQFNPINESVTQFLEYANSKLCLLQQWIKFAKEIKQLDLNYLDLVKIKFPKHLYCHFQIRHQKKIMAQGDDLAEIKQQLAPLIDQILLKQTSQQQIDNITSYIPELSNLLTPVQNLTIGGYYSLLLASDGSISYGVIANLDAAKINSSKGLIALFKLQMYEQQRYLEQKKLVNFASISLNLRNIYTNNDLIRDIKNYVLNWAIAPLIDWQLPLTETLFKQWLVQARARTSEGIHLINNLLTSIAQLYAEIRSQLNAQHPLHEIIELQLDDLIYPNFLRSVRIEYLQNYPRYLQAIILRLTKYANSPMRFEQLEDEVSNLYQQWYDYVDELELSKRQVLTQLYDFKYKIEELRISFFAQEIKTLYPVSTKRLAKELQQLYLHNLQQN